MNFDMVIYNGTIITVNSDFDIIKDGFVGIKNGKFAQIGKFTDDFTVPTAEEVIDAEGGIIMPGLVNTHTHLPMTLFRGLADDLPLFQWLHEYIFPAEQKYIQAETVRYGTLLGCVEMILGGTTTCCDGYFFADEIAKAVYDSGMRAILGQGVIDFPAPGVPDPKENIQVVLKFAEKWQNVSPLIVPSIFCHSPYTCSRQTLKKAKDAADSKAMLFQIHVAETKNEWDRIYSEHQTTPIKYLDQIGILDPNTLLVHTIWVDDEDIALIARRGAKISVTTESEMKLASGIAPIPDFLRCGISVGLGTDGCASNNDLDLFREMDSTAKLHKVNTLNPTVLDAPSVLKMATLEGAKAIGLEKDIGSLEVGKQADLIIIDTDKPHLVPMYNPVSHVIYAAVGSDVRDVMVAGKMIVRNKNLLTLDIQEILARVTRISKNIRI
ncbi:MAG: amidohydrolase [Desulfobacterales bacterium]|nr:amidohydrolase [Desulfobacterales bacterium]